MGKIGILAKIARHLSASETGAAEDKPVELLIEAEQLLRDMAREIGLLRSFIEHSGVWLPIASAPHDQRILLFTGAEIYAAHWVQSMDTGHEAWMIGEMPDGMQAVVTATHWLPAPKPPCTDAVADNLSNHTGADGNSSKLSSGYELFNFSIYSLSYESVYEAVTAGVRKALKTSPDNI
ncbi:MAG: hypothetical protein WC426_02475 [Sulfuriferula sp.]